MMTQVARKLRYPGLGRSLSGKLDSRVFAESARCDYSSTPKGKEEGAPFRYPLEWGSTEFYDEKELERETRRVFDVCHGCRRCYSLCNSFPTLFSLVDNSKTGELDSVPSAEFKRVVDDCTLCDMCFIAKCPYVPPHSLNIDFPHLMLRYRAVENAKRLGYEAGSPPPLPFPVSGVDKNPENVGEKTEFTEQVTAGTDKTLSFEPPGFVSRQLNDMDKNSKLVSMVAPVANWATKTDSSLASSPRFTRRLLERILGVHAHAALPRYVPPQETLVNQTKNSLPPNVNAPAYKSGRKVLLYSTCSGNWNKPSIGLASRAVLSHNGVEVKIAYPGCCGMPQLEQGDLPSVADKATRVAKYMKKWIDEGWDVVALVPSCVLMLKQEWSSLLPQEPSVLALAKNVKDVSEYIIDIHKNEGLTPGLQPIDAGVALHNACHARAQNVGFKAEEMLSLVPSLSISVVEACSGHGGSWGLKKENFATALKVGERAVKKTLQHIEDFSPRNPSLDATEGEEGEAAPQKVHDKHFLSSECPLAADHIQQGLPESAAQLVGQPKHPIEIFAMSYGLSY